MARDTLTDDFWANDILWQLSVFAYNISIMMRQSKSKFKRQEHRTFIDWFISVPAKITNSGRQMELKLYEHHFYKPDWDELDRLIEAAYKQRQAFIKFVVEPILFLYHYYKLIESIIFVNKLLN